MLFQKLFVINMVAASLACVSTRAFVVDEKIKFRVATYNVLSDHYKHPNSEHVRSLDNWGDCSSATRCALAKTIIEKADADILAVQEIPEAAFIALSAALPDYDAKHASSTKKIRAKDKVDGVAIFWKKTVLSKTNDRIVAFNATENSYRGKTDDKPAMLLYLRPKDSPNFIIGVASSHFGDSIYQSDEDASGRSKMDAILNKFEAANSTRQKFINIILGDYNQDQFYREGYAIEAPGKGTVVYDEKTDKIKRAVDRGYVNGSVDASLQPDHYLSVTWTSPQMKYEIKPPHKDLSVKKLGEDRCIDWGLFKASDPSKLKVTRVHGDFDQFELTYDDIVPRFLQGEDVLRASDHVPVVFDVEVEESKD